jgi:predicted nuclease of restriction endonuclease-like (RecB) superfamily
MCVTYYEVGRLIVEQEQSGASRAAYGKKLLDELSAYLIARCGKGWSVGNLKNARQFYQVYSPTIRKSVISELGEEQSWSAQFTLSWTHYLILMRIKDEDARRFYEIEAKSQQWTVRQLKRQCDSSLYERIALSRNKDEVMRLALEGQTLEKPHDMMKNPLVLEFLDLEQNPAYSESELELAIIANLQKFLLELGKGFLFEARQKRFAFDEKSFFVDLVFYNRLLQCYVLIDMKTGELHHQDLGQMQMYVHYFDRYVKKVFEKPTVGILLCQEKNDNIVELTLPEDSNIYASEYSLYLPDKALLERKLAEWTAEFEEEHRGKKKSRK